MLLMIPSTPMLARAQLSSSAPQVTVIGSVAKIRPHDRPVGADFAQVVAAQNEFESFQIVIQAGEAPMENLVVSLGDPLTGSHGAMIPKGNVTIYREDYYRVKTPSDDEGTVGLWPDALIPTVDPYYHEPRQAFPIDVPAGDNRVVWVDVLVPEAAPAGLYDGSVRVTASGFAADVPVRLTVLDFVLPSTASHTSAFHIFWRNPCEATYGPGDDCQSHPEDGWLLNALYARAALDNRITISAPWYQIPTTSERERLFREHIQPLLAGVPSPKHPELSPRLRGAALTSLDVTPDFDESTAGADLAAWKAEATRGSFADRAFVYVCDEPGTDGELWNRECRQHADLATEVWPDVPILLTASIQDAAENDAVGYVDWLVTNIVQMHNTPDTDTYASNQRAKYDAFLAADPRHRLWLYTSCTSHGCPNRRREGFTCGNGTQTTAETASSFGLWPGYIIDAAASEARAMGWLAFAYETSGELYYRVDYCLSLAWQQQYAWGGNGDGTLFYPGTPGRIGGTHPIPIESMRLKLIRDGYEDFEYLHELALRGQRSEALAIAGKLFPNLYSTDRSDEFVQEARRQLACMIDAQPSLCTRDAVSGADDLNDPERSVAVLARRGRSRMSWG